MSEKTYQALIQLTRGLCTALRERDAYTRLHSDRVMNLSIEIGKRMGIPSHAIILLKAAAALHDIGKLGIPDEVLLKTGTLAEQEMAVMHRHSESGARIVMSLRQDGSEVVAEAIRHHHECFDGQGYPDRLRGENIPLFSRIITIADNYDAMATRRVYQSPRRHNAIMTIMENEMGHKHDPAIFAEFIRVIETSDQRVH